MTSDILDWLQRWYSSNCNGDWEFDYGIRINTLANPGWSIFIDVAETPLVSAEFTPITIEREEHDWIHCRVREWRFEGFGGPSNLIELLETFRSWTSKAAGKQTASLPVGSEENDSGKVLRWIQGWYHSHCDGEWERAKGIRIKTVDNPGWSMFINLSNTELSEVAFAPLRMDRGQDGWIQCQVLDDRFKGTCGLHNLTELLATFRAWANSSGNGGGRNGS